MIDEQKVFGMLQAKALGCLDADENKELQSFIDEGYLFPWDELGTYQNTVSLLPLTLQLEIPDAELKDKVALKLIKLRDELRAQKSLEEEKKQLEPDEELIEEEVDENVEEFTTIQEPYIEPAIEIESEQVTKDITDELNSTLNAEEASFNLDEVVLPGFEPTEISEPVPETGSLENMGTEAHAENLIQESMTETPDIEEMNVEEAWSETEISQPIDIEGAVVNNEVEAKQIEETIINAEPEIKIVEETVVNDEAETKQVEETLVKEVIDTKQAEETEDADKHPDFTKKSVAEKMYRAIEQDFDYLKDHYERSERKLTRGLLISYVVMAALLALLIFLFFKFSSDINGLENEIKNLKKNTSLFEERKINSDEHHFS